MRALFTTAYSLPLTVLLNHEEGLLAAELYNPLILLWSKTLQRLWMATTIYITIVRHVNIPVPCPIISLWYIYKYCTCTSDQADLVVPGTLGDGLSTSDVFGEISRVRK